MFNTGLNSSKLNLYKVCILAVNYWPIVPGQGTRHPKVISELLENHCDLTIITTHVDKTKGKSFVVEYEGKKKIIRIPFKRFNGKGFFPRALTYLSFAISCIFAAMYIDKHSLIFSVGPDPPYFSLTTPILSRIKSSRNLALLTDMLPDVAFDVGLVKSKVAKDIIRYFCIQAYRNADHIMVITDKLKTRLIHYGVQPERISVVPLAVDTKTFAPRSADQKLVAELKINNKFIVLYSGSFGQMYDFDLLLEAARSIQEYNSNINFIIRGDGAQKSHIAEKISSLDLKNTVLLGPVDSTDLIVSYINLASICVVPMKDSKSIDMTHPSKIFEFWSCGKPVICTSRGELADLVNRSKAGIAIPPGDKQALVDAILRLYNDQTILNNMSVSARTFVENEFSYHIVREKMLNVIERLHRD
ncbi:putative glycosyl transferase, group 1 [Candidatus Nitrososphaera gargensis Ga9.2]|uniref:Putative glycosyl transferase, group 1 n=1 Tax=Nitrososphaera gargensis (strain Ga9.2) TaxID=1237085 RepID=K0I954_NITGG|nr:putative glycosyl transferase, group 1 [Candidatus Nitrososphaera gargensis Ga9.2]